MNVWFLRLAVIYLVIGVFLGMWMGITQLFDYAPAHAHINLLGWATLALAGVIYTLFPRAGNNRLAIVHFWLHNIGLPIFVIALVCLPTMGAKVEPLISTGAVIAILGILIFAINVLVNVRRSAA